LADLLKRKKKRGKGDADSLNSLPLERQSWYHGKITADFAERYLRRDGNFLVREDPAKPGSCFIVVRHKRSPLHIPLCKVNSSKGTRIKYRLEDSDNSFDSIAELINYHITQKKPLSNTSAIITHAVSRDATLLSADDLKSLNANQQNRYVSNTGPSNLCPPKPPGTGPLRQKNIDKMGRKNSDPGLHLEINHNGNKSRHFTVGSLEKSGLPLSPENLPWTVQSKQREKIPEAFLAKSTKEENISERFYETTLGENEKENEKDVFEDLDHFYEDPNKKDNLGTYYDKPSENESASMSIDEGNRKGNCVKQNEGENVDSCYDKPVEDCCNGDFYDTPSTVENSVEFYDKPSKQFSLASLSDNNTEGRENLLYDQPRGSSDGLYDRPKGSDENVYDKPPAKPKRMESFRNSDPTVSEKVNKLRPQLKTRSSAPALRTFTGLPSGGRSESRFNALPEKRHSGAELLMRHATSGAMASDGINAEADACYDTPPSRSNNSPSSSGSDFGSLANQEIYDVPTDLGSSSEQVLSSNSTSDISDKTQNTKDKEDKSPRMPMDKKGIFLNVMKKIGEKLLLPFLESDCLSLARHMTRVDLVFQWGEEPHRQSWSIEDGTGGAKGLELLTLPQGRDKRAQLLARFANVTHWVATLVVAAGDLGTRGKVLSKLIELADVLSDKLGNLVSFMAIMEGLALPQVTRLHHTWSCLHHQSCSTAILYHSTLKPLAGLLSSGAPSPFPGVCLPYIIPLVRYMEMTPDEILNDWAHAEVDLGLDTIIAHLDSGRTLTQQLDEFRREAVARLQTDEYIVDCKLLEYFRERLNVGNVLGLGPDPTNKTNKLRTLLQWLSENAEHSTSTETSGAV